MDRYEKRVLEIQDYISKLNLPKEIISFYKGRNILVTGGAGAIGSNLIIALSLLVGDDGKVVILDNLSAVKYKEAWNVTPLPNVMFALGDVRNEVDLKRVFKEDISLVFHLAAFFANQNSVDYPEYCADCCRSQRPKQKITMQLSKALNI